MYIAAFAVSAYSSTYHRAGCKPFNPVLGETYECERPDRGFRFISEQVWALDDGGWLRRWLGQGRTWALQGPGCRRGRGQLAQGQALGHMLEVQRALRRRAPCLVWGTDLKQGVSVPSSRAEIMEAYKRFFSAPWEGVL